MKWRYAAARETTESGIVMWSVRELYSDGSWTASNAEPSGWTLDELREDLHRMSLCLDHKDIIDLDEGRVVSRPEGGLMGDKLWRGEDQQ